MTNKLSVDALKEIVGAVDYYRQFGPPKEKLQCVVARMLVAEAFLEWGSVKKAAQVAQVAPSTANEYLKECGLRLTDVGERAVQQY